MSFRKIETRRHKERKDLNAKEFKKIAQGLTTAATPTTTFTAASEMMRSPEAAGWGLAVVQIGQNLGMVLGPLRMGRWIQSLGWVNAGYLISPFMLLGLVSGWLVRVR